MDDSYARNQNYEIFSDDWNLNVLPTFGVDFDFICYIVSSSDGRFWNFYTRFDSIFWKKITISNYERFLPSIKDY